ncbi:MAG: hypothetical protein IJ324_00735 [Lachnospiraceae bacterium]|nr:hypothetical protein [Lachnospiraceae bacterium]
MENNMKNNEQFEYTYSAKQQSEVEAIRKKYLPKEENKMETLRKLDRSVESAGQAASLAVGVIGCLLLGVGMCCTMVWSESLFVVGILVGILGMVVMGFAYPVYKKITRKKREQLAPQIIALSEELLTV